MGRCTASLGGGSTFPPRGDEQAAVARHRGGTAAAPAAQASAARKVIRRDPGFAADALATIETASRRAASELDAMLGLLRDETKRPMVPAPGLDSLDGLLTMARSAGLTVDAPRGCSASSTAAGPRSSW